MSIAGLRVAYVVCLFGCSPVNAADNVSQHKFEAVLGATILIYDLSGNWESLRVKKLQEYPILVPRLPATWNSVTGEKASPEFLTVLFPCVRMLPFCIKIKFGLKQCIPMLHFFDACHFLLKKNHKIFV
ncbi:hypothetical protein ACQ7UY_004588 [Escherichia coli]